MAECGYSSSVREGGVERAGVRLFGITKGDCYASHIISTTHDAAARRRPIAITLSSSLTQTVIYHGVFIEHAPASHLIIIMERRVELLSPLINVRPSGRPNICVRDDDRRARRRDGG